jgi:hypothetical protein
MAKGHDSAGAPTGAEAPLLIEGTRAGMEMKLAEGTVRDVTPHAVSASVER